MASTNMRTVGQEANGTRVTLHVDEQLEVLLPSNPSTGYAWKEIQLADREFLRLDHADYVEPGQGDIYGSNGKHQWLFTAMQPGEVEIELHYQRPWDDSTVHQTFHLTVHVKET